MSEIQEILETIQQDFKDVREIHKSELEALQERVEYMENLPVGPRNPLELSQNDIKSAILSVGSNSFTTELNDFARRGMVVGDDPSGGFVVTPQRGPIQDKIFESSQIRPISRVISITSDAYEEPQQSSDPAAGWVGETETRDETTSPELRLFRVPLHEMYAEPHTTQKLLDTNDYDIATWLQNQIVQKFVRMENTTFVLGTGVKQPRGFLTYDVSESDDDSRTWGNLQIVKTGANGAFASSDPADKLIDCVYSLKADYRSGARWLMNRSTAGVVRKLKDADGNYLWQVSAVLGQPDTLLGFPVTLAEDMPDIAADSLSIAFGNFQRGYTVIDHPNIVVLRDNYTKKGTVKFYTARRVGGDVADFDAIKLVQFAA